MKLHINMSLDMDVPDHISPEQAKAMVAYLAGHLHGAIDKAPMMGAARLLGKVNSQYQVEGNEVENVAS